MTEQDFKANLTPDDARQAVYIDFEGRIGKPPVLLGVLYNESKRKNRERLVLCHYVVDPIYTQMQCTTTFDGVARHEYRVMHIKAAMNDIIRRAVKQERKIVSWSQHDRAQVVASRIARTDQAAFDAHFVDGKATAKRWMNAHHPEARPGWESHGGRYKLVHFLSLVGLDLPADYGRGQVGGWLKTSAEATTTRGSWDALLDSQRERWQRILAHNAFDCLAMCHVVTTAADAVAAASEV